MMTGDTASPRVENIMDGPRAHLPFIVNYKRFSLYILEDKYVRMYITMLHRVFFVVLSINYVFPLAKVIFFFNKP